MGESSRELSVEHLDTTELVAESRLRRAGKGIRLIVGGGRAAKPDRQMIALLRNAYATRDALMSGRDATIDALAQRLGVKRDYLSAHMRLTYLAPGIVRDLFEGRQPEVSQRHASSHSAKNCRATGSSSRQPSELRPDSACQVPKNDASLTGRKRPSEIIRAKSRRTSCRDGCGLRDWKTDVDKARKRHYIFAYGNGIICSDINDLDGGWGTMIRT